MTTIDPSVNPPTSSPASPFSSGPVLTPILPPDSTIDTPTTQQLVQLARRRRPYEACGLLQPVCQDHFPTCRRVLEMENQALTHALDPSDAYVISGMALSTAMVTYIDTHPTFRAILEVERDRWLAQHKTPPEHQIRSHFAVWHSHPGGFTGPSKRDMHSKTPGFGYLVVALSAHAGGSDVSLSWF